MTIEETINTLNSLKDYYNDGFEDNYVGFDDDDNKAIDMAIKALEQQSCEDCISRDEALKAIEKEKQGWEGTERYAVDECHTRIAELPSVTPKAGSEDKEKDMTIAEAVHTLRMRLPVGYSQTEEAAHYVVKEIVEERAIALDSKDLSRFCDDFCRYPREYDEEKEGEYMTEKVCSTCPLGRL